MNQVISYVTILLSLFTILSGCYSYMLSIKNLMFLHWAGYAWAFICLEILHWIWKKNWWFGNKLGFNWIKWEWTMEKFLGEISKGKRYCLFDDVVLDLTYYIHPGGPMFIHTIIGQDVGQYLNGSLSNVDGAKPYLHSSYAYSIMRSLAIARIVKP